MSTNTLCLGGVSLIIGQHAAAEVPQELRKSGCRHPLVVTDPSILKLGLCSELFAALEQAGLSWAVFCEVPSDPPASAVAAGTASCLSQGCDSVIGLGGGSVLDCAKAIKMMSTHAGSILDYRRGGRQFENPGLPLFSVPTTSGTGSEVTQYAVITDEETHVKTTIGDTMAGLVSQAGSGAAHGIGAGFGAMYHVPHGEAVGIFLPYVMAYNLPACPERFREIARAMGTDVSGLSLQDAALASVTQLQDLLKQIRFVRLRDYIKSESELPLLAEKALQDHCSALNAIPLTEPDQCRLILDHAWHETL